MLSLVLCPEQVSENIFFFPINYIVSCESIAAARCAVAISGRARCRTTLLKFVAVVKNCCHGVDPGRNMNDDPMATVLHNTNMMNQPNNFNNNNLNGPGPGNNNNNNNNGNVNNNNSNVNINMSQNLTNSSQPPPFAAAPYHNLFGGLASLMQQQMMFGGGGDLSKDRRSSQKGLVVGGMNNTNNQGSGYNNNNNIQNNVNQMSSVSNVVNNNSNSSSSNFLNPFFNPLWGSVLQNTFMSRGDQNGGKGANGTLLYNKSHAPRRTRRCPLPCCRFFIFLERPGIGN